ncbi:hypothetical protein ACEPAG_4623 [Sanghuangporus baumii]
MSNGNFEGDGNMWRSQVTSSSSSKLATLKNLVPATQRDAVRAFFDRRIPVATPFPASSSSRDAQSLGVDPPSGYPQDRKMSWREWAGDKLRGRGPSVSDAVEKVQLFPGWAARRYHDPDMEGKEAAEFALEVFVSGFAASYVPPEYATRSQRAFMRLAKAYAALPKVPSPSERPPYSSATSTRTLSKSTEDLLKTVKLPPTPNNITEQSEIAALESQFQKAELDMDTESIVSESDSAPSSSNGTPPSFTPISSSGVSYATASGQFAYSLTDLTRLHANLNTRLHPFWSRSLPNRVVRLSLFSSSPGSSSRSQDGPDDDDPTRSPIDVHHVQTDAQGAFETRLRIPWDRICVHPGALHVAFGDIDDDAELFICAELLPPPSPVNMYPQPQQEITARSVLPVTLSQSQIRLISDIDDTIKLSNILGGARTVFHNVFVRHLEELVIHGMGDWYTRMWSRGVRFHYVSNSPFELLPVINEFIKVSNLPGGSIKLRSYAGRSLFNGLLSAPAIRKRSGVVDILNAFSNSRFILVGDSGEQDLELYAQLAAERHNQILAVFIRDARGPDAIPISDPTGEEIKRCPPPSRTASYASGMSTSATSTSVLGGWRSNTMPPPPTLNLEATPTQKSFARFEGLNGSRTSLPSHIDKSVQDYISARPGSAAPNVSRISAQQAQLQKQQQQQQYHRPIRPARSSSAPLTPTLRPSTLGLPSTFFDSGLTVDTNMSTTSSPASSRPPSPSSASSSLGSVSLLQYPGSLTEAEIAALPPSEKKRYKLQERVYRARLLMPSHIPLRVFVDPEECVEADRVLDDMSKAGWAVRTAMGQQRCDKR